MKKKFWKVYGGGKEVYVLTESSAQARQEAVRRIWDMHMPTKVLWKQMNKNVFIILLVQ